MLIILGGLPGVGKTTIARELARLVGAVHVRIDSIEQAVRESGVTAVSLDDAGAAEADVVSGLRRGPPARPAAHAMIVDLPGS